MTVTSRGNDNIARGTRDRVKHARGKSSGGHKGRIEDFSSVAGYATMHGNACKSGAKALLCAAVKSERGTSNNGLIVVARERSNLVLPIALKLEGAAEPR